MAHMRCEVEHCIHHLQNNLCELKDIHITANGLDTNCGDYERKLSKADTTTIFSYTEPDDTMEMGPFD